MKACKWCGLTIYPATSAARTCGGHFTCTHRQAFDEGEEQGRADERAAIVAWLLTDAPGLADTRAHIAALIRTGCHEKVKP